MGVLARHSQPPGTTFVEVLRWRALYHPDHVASTFLLDGETRQERYTYAELDARARQIATLLQAHLAPGDRALLLYPPGLEYIAALFGCWYAGIVAVPAYPPRLNQNLTRIERMIQDADAQVALTTSAMLSSLQRKFADDPLVHGLHWLVPERESLELTARWKEYLPTTETVALLQYTSGSTGTPKGVIITHDNLIQNAILIQRGMSLKEHMVCVSWLPAYHDMGLMGLTLEPLYLGGTSVLMAPASFLLKPLRWLQAITSFRAFGSGAPNFAFDLCVEKATPEALATLDLSTWEMAFVGSEPIRAETLDRFAQTFAPCGLRPEALYPCYGMAEATLFVTGGFKQEPAIVRHFARQTLEQHRPMLVHAQEAEARPLVGCGHPQPEQQVLIVDPVSHTRCAPQHVGEIWVAGPNVAQGYWRKPQETHETFQAFTADTHEGPFLRTGDLGFLWQGELFLTGRCKDLMIIRGQNYAPQDIESAAERSHQALRSHGSAAFSVEVEGEEQAILVMELERQHRQREPQELFSTIRQAVIDAHHLHVAAIVLMPPGSILKTSSGKIQRGACREAFLAQKLAVLFADLPPAVRDLLAQQAARAGQRAEAILPPTPIAPAAALHRPFAIASPQDDALHDNKLPAPPTQADEKPMQFSLLYGSSQTSQSHDQMYELLLEGAKFADQHDFTAVWVPERHFHPSGGGSPSPAVLASALAVTTHTIRLRAAGVVFPTHQPIRVAEEWSVIDHLSAGRVDLAFASGENPQDFVLAPTRYPDRHNLLFSQMETFQKLWRGDAITLPNGLGQETTVKIYPLPKQRKLTPWITCTGNPAQFREAGAMGANVLTALFFQSPAELAEKITLYRQARAHQGYDPATGHVTVMLHTFLGDDVEEVDQKVHQPFLDDLSALAPQWYPGGTSLDALIPQEHALFGTPQSCRKMVDRLTDIGVDELACLIDFGVDRESVMENLSFLNRLRKRCQQKTPRLRNVPAQDTVRMGGGSPPTHVLPPTEPEKTPSESARTPRLDAPDLSLRERLAHVSASQQLVLLEQYLQQQVAQALKRPVEEMARVENIRGLALDSLMIVNIVNHCQQDLAIALDAGQFYEHPTFPGLAGYLAEEWRCAQLQSQEETGASEVCPALPRQKQQTVFPLSLAQQRLWFLSQLEPSSVVYNVPMVLQITGDLVIEALQWSWHEIIQRHESLRTSFSTFEEQAVQVIHENRAFPLPRVELNHLPAEIRAREVHQLAALEGQSPFDLTQGPLIRATLLLVQPQEHVLLLTYHHIIMDGWSRGILMQELQTLYTAFLAGHPSPLAALPIQYADFAVWQRRWLQSPLNTDGTGTQAQNEAPTRTRLEEQIAYWQRQLAGPLPTLELPTASPRPAVQTFHGAHRSIHLPEPLMDELQELSQREGVTLFMTLLASFQVFLARLSGHEDLLVGTPSAGRNRAEIEPIIGFFVNTLVLRTDLSGNPTFRELLGRVKAVCLGAYAHQDVPFEQVVEVVQPERDRSRSPLFQVMFELQQASWWLEAELPGASLQQVPTESGISLFDLTWSMTSRGVGEIEYNTDVFTAATIECLLGHWQVLLQSIIADPLLPISALSLLSPQERAQQVGAWNQTQAPDVTETCLAHRITAQASQTPDRIALSFHEEQLSYAQLEQRASHLACVLQAGGVGPECLVALLAQRSIPLVVGILAVFKAGGAYLPLDPTMPSQRLSQILHDAHPHVLLTAAHLAWQVPSIDSLSWLSLDMVMDSGPFPGFPWQEETWCDPQQGSYVIYTSGSTGRPKGVVIHQQGLLNHLSAKMEELQLQPQDCVAQNASLSFDISVWQMWAALLQGGRVHLFSAEEAQQPHRLWWTVRKQAITVLQVVPSLLRLLLEELEGDGAGVDHLRVVLATGEALPPDLCRRWWQQQPEIPLVNAYGPTECSDDVTHAWLTPASAGSTERVPIGRPLRNTRLYVLDRWMELVPVGMVGELYVGGKGVGRGYLDAPEQTGRSFVPDPWSQEPGARLYRTGDLVRYRDDGQLEYVGRVDEQVKLRGYRIELGEIEATLRRQPAIEEAVVVVREDVAEEACLVAYVVAGKHGEELEEEAIRRNLQATLPDYMVPRYVVPLAALPVTANGKVDRRALPVPERRKGERTQSMTARTAVEEMIMDIYRDVLGVEQIGLHESFFHLGGHSLLAIQVIARLRERMQIEIPLRRLFETPSVAGLAQHIESMLRREEARALPPLVPVSREQDIPLSFAQERLWFLQQLEPDDSAYHVSAAFRLSGPLSIEIFDRSLQVMVQRHESLRTTFEIRSEQPAQVLHAHLAVNMPVIDLHDMDESMQALVASQWIRKARGCPFDLGRGPLMRVGLLHVGKDEYVFSVVMHHIVVDEWSVSVFLHEFLFVYEALVQEKPVPLAPLLFHYADFAFWQRGWLQGEALNMLVEYWTEQLRGAVSLELPTDRPRAQVVSNRGAMYPFKLSAQLVQALRMFSRREGVTLFMTLLSSLLIVLYHTTGQQDLVVGTDIADRRMRETEDMIGFFINLLAVRLRLNVQATFRETVKSLCSVMLDGYAHQDLPFEKLVEELQLRREPGRVPLVNVLFVFENVPPRTFELPGLVISQVETDSLVNAAKFDVAVFLVEEGQELLGSVNYRTDLFDAGTIERLVRHFEVLLQNSVTHPDIPIKLLETQTEEEKEQKMREDERDAQIQRHMLKATRRRAVTPSLEN